jgi:hypothetical protein
LLGARCTKAILEANVQSVLALAVLSNLKITVSETRTLILRATSYGKVLESVADTPGGARIWFTSISPDLRTWLSALG